MNLADLTILTLDCQTTGANPTRGHLLEIGWVTTRAAARARVLSVESHFVGLPEGACIPPAVQRVTGLSEKLSKTALPASAIWEKIVSAAREIAAADSLERCPTVIHYARFEEPFLRHLNAANHREGEFPLHILCSHEIARRLLPGLPRKGLRAVAGFLGHSVPPLRRTADHAVATAFIWQHLVRRLADQHHVKRLTQLIDWLENTPVQGATKRVYPMKPEVRRQLPDKPGVYRMRRCNGDLLYIGKATSLKQRVNSYFRPKSVRAEHTLEMLSQAADLDVTQTGSALEAAILESDEIKSFAPPYNVALQKGRRKLVFGSSGLRRYAGKSDSAHCIGPLPEGSLPAALTAFAKLQASNTIPSINELLQIGTAILALPQSLAPPPDCLIEGLSMFYRQHLSKFSRSSPLADLRRLGALLWREKIAALRQAAARALEDEIEAEDGELLHNSAQEPTWVPESVVRAVERTLMQGELLIRRARWLCLLSDSTLTWEVRGSNGAERNVLVFAAGAVSRSAQLPVGEKAPLPPGYANRLTVRQKHFDISTYERLRVVTTELRRLVADGRSIAIRIKPHAVLTHRQLAKLLPWV